MYDGSVIRNFWIWTALAAGSALVSGYHGYRRHHNSTGAAVGWAVLGLFFPIITPVVALAEGYADPL